MGEAGMGSEQPATPAARVWWAKPGRWSSSTTSRPGQRGCRCLIRLPVGRMSLTPPAPRQQGISDGQHREVERETGLGPLTSAWELVRRDRSESARVAPARAGRVAARVSAGPILHWMMVAGAPLAACAVIGSVALVAAALASLVVAGCMAVALAPAIARFA